MSGANSRASLARSLASSARVSASDDSGDVCVDAPPSRLNEPAAGVRLATAVAPAPVACTVSAARDAPSSDVLNGTSAKSPPLVPPPTQSDVPVSPVIAWPSVSVVAAAEQSVLAICVAVAVARATIAPPCTVAVTSTSPAALPSVNCVEAVPLASVTAVVGESVPTPEEIEKATVTPATGLSAALVTLKTIGDASVALMEPVCPLPLTAAIAAADDPAGLVESLQAVAMLTNAVASTARRVRPRRAVIREGISFSTFRGVRNRNCVAIACVHFLQHTNAAIPYFRRQTSR
jgi:hypothetical protein